MKPRNIHAGSPLGAPAFFSQQVIKARRFHLDLNPPRQRRLSVVCGGLELCQPDYSIHRESFPFNSFEYVARGRGELKLNGQLYTLHPGWLFSYGPGIRHHIIGSQTDPLVKYFVDFTGKRAIALLRTCHLLPGRVTQVFPPNVLVPLFGELVECGQQAGPRTAELCARLLECLALKITTARTPSAATETSAFATYRQCREYIERNFLNLRTLDQVAGACHGNKAYLCRLFQRFDQQTPYQYLLRLKMNHASALLLQPNVMVKQAAEEVGFPDPFHFSRVFKSVLGLSPDAFRRMR